MNDLSTTKNLKPNDFATNQEVRWCPGCGDYAILKAIKTVLSEVGARRENTLFVSGIGCSSRLPYYIDTFGFHTIHGRAPTIATGALLANPDLDVWIITGDGDGLSIGGNHLMHLLRRNVNCQVLLFNNEIYGLTKGQYSPTSHVATRTPTSPIGSVDTPVNPTQFALGAGGRFVARGVDTQIKQLIEIFKAAYLHRGTSFVEIFQNCIVFNEDVFEDFTAKPVLKEQQIQIEHGAPMIYGAEDDKALTFDPGHLGLNATSMPDSAGREPMVHDVTNRNLAFALSNLKRPENPMVTGILYNNPDPCYHDQMDQSARDYAARVGNERQNLNDVMRSGAVWRVEEEG